MRKTIPILAMIGGGCATLVGPLIGLLVAAITWLGRETGSSQMLLGFTSALALAVLGVFLGLPLLRAGWHSYRGTLGRPLTLPRWQWLLVVFIGTLVAGQSAYSAGIFALVPVFHVAAGALPSLLFLSVVVRSGERGGKCGPRRWTVGNLTWGALGSSGCALILEMIVGGAILLVGIVALSVTNPQLIDQVTVWAAQAQSGGEGGDMMGDLAPLLPLLRSPLVILGVLTFVAGLAPLIEEGMKSLGVVLAAASTRGLRRVDGFVLGVAAGAGFALFEGVFNGLIALSDPDRWATLMMVRSAAAAMHCLASGLAGLGWYALIVDRASLRGVGLMLLALLLHGFWNAVAIGQALAALNTTGLSGDSPIMFAALMVVVLAVLWVAVVIALAVIPRRLAKVQPAPIPVPGTHAFVPTSSQEGLDLPCREDEIEQ